MSRFVRALGRDILYCVTPKDDAKVVDCTHTFSRHETCATLPRESREQAMSVGGGLGEPPE